MSLYDFVKKQPRNVREQGLKNAAADAFGEVGMTLVQPYSDYKSRSIWDDEWDVCLILDSCRYDLWQEVDGRGRSEWSVGSASPEWIGKTFADGYEEQWRNAAYVTANPFSGKQGNELDCLDEDVYPLSTRGLGYLDEVWRDQWPMASGLETVDPDVLTERAIWAWNGRERFGVDNLIVHYMQPHIPFRTGSEWSDGWDTTGVFGEPQESSAKDDWLKLRDGEIPEEDFWSAYADNLRWGLEEVEKWRRNLNGELLVTSDHGNAMGECGEWGHRPGSGNPAMRKVPWLHLDGNGGGFSDVQPPGSPPEIGGAAAPDEQLRALGYK